MCPLHEEDFGQLGYVVFGFAVHEVEVLLGVAEIGPEPQSTLVVEDGEAVFFQPVVGVAEVVVEVGRLVSGIQHGVVGLYGGGKVAFGVGFVALLH